MSLRVRHRKTGEERVVPGRRQLIHPDEWEVVEKLRSETSIGNGAMNIPQKKRRD